jgi:hypothetical protein
MGKTQHADFGSNLAPTYNQAPGDSPLEKQYASDQQAWQKTAQANRPASINPSTIQQWVQAPDGSWVVQSDLKGELGKANTDLQHQYGQMAGQPLATGDQARDQAINAAYGQATSRLDPQWDKRQEAQRTQLLNQGLDPSSEAYKSQMQDFGLQRNDAYSSAMNAAIGQGTQAGNQIFQNALAGRNNQLDQIQALQAMALKGPQVAPLNMAPSQQWMNAQIADNNMAVGQATNQQQQNADTAAGIGQIASLAAVAAA